MSVICPNYRSCSFVHVCLYVFHVMCFHVFLASNPTRSLSSLNVFPLIHLPLPTSFYHCLRHPYPFLFPFLFFPNLVHNACFFSVYTWHITVVCDSYNISLFLCHTSSPSRPLSTRISYFSSNSSLSLFYRARLWKEAEVGRDPSGFDQVKIIIRYSLPFMDAYCFSRGNPGGHIDLSCFKANFTLPAGSLSHSVKTPSGNCFKLPADNDTL